jgi:hypothetical protein
VARRLILDFTGKTQCHWVTLGSTQVAESLSKSADCLAKGDAGEACKTSIPGSNPGGASNLFGSIPVTWVTDYSGDMGNTFGPKGFAIGSRRRWRPWSGSVGRTLN